MGHIICIISQKGGTGKTTTAVNLAASLAVFEKKTLVIDCDPQGNATTGLGINKKKLSNDLYSFLTHKVSSQDILSDTDLKFLKAIPSKYGPLHFETNPSGGVNIQKSLQNLVHGVVDQFEYIIIDTSPAPGALSMAALAASEWLLIPLQYQIYALEGLGRLLNRVQQVRKTLNANLKIGGILFTMCDENVEHLLAQSIKTNSSNLKNNIFTTTIPYDGILRASSDFVKPIVLYDIKSKGAKAYLDLAIEIMNMLEFDGKKIFTK
ncbi:MAG: ParA family protein [Desulfobacterales bacterium]|nr:ParA family protein [Desulfobacterales bacterium]